MAKARTAGLGEADLLEVGGRRVEDGKRLAVKGLQLSYHNNTGISALEFRCWGLMLN